MEAPLGVCIRTLHYFLSFTRVWLSRRVNLGRGRTAPESVRDKKEKILVHRSVKTRMETKELKYEPQVNFREFDYDFVD